MAEKFHNPPVAAHSRVPAEVVAAVWEAFVNMAKDVQGRGILETSAELVKRKPPVGFSPSDDSEYDNYRKFYKNTLLKGL